MQLLYGFLAYGAAGLLVAVAFLTIGVTRVLEPPRPASPGARLMLLPGTVLLWPYVLVRWVRAETVRS